MMRRGLECHLADDVISGVRDVEIAGLVRDTARLARPQARRPDQRKPIFSKMKSDSWLCVSSIGARFLFWNPSVTACK